ncbi:MAG: maleylacetate reductase [Pseudomonadota bacterium]
MRFEVGQAASIVDALDEIDADNVLFVCTKKGADRYRYIRDRLGPREVALFDGAQSHCPQPVVDAAVQTYAEVKADVVVAVGGGSTLGIGKILKAEHGAKFIAVPTTYSGSEMTPIYGRKIDGQKKTRVDPAAIPDMVIYDPELTRDLPVHQTAATGMNSLAHAVEALYPAAPNPIAFDLAVKAIGLHARALPAAISEPNDINARTDALYAGFLGGLLVSMVGVALHHALGHVLGGLFELEHGDYNSVVLSHVMAYNAPAAPEAAAAVCDALGADDPGVGLYSLAQSINAPTSLAALGMPGDGVEKAAEAIVKKAPRNPRAIDMESMVKLLSAAHAGDRPCVADYV